jgi:hypothetical protein
VDGTASGSCPVASFYVGGTEPSGSAAGELLVRWIVEKLEGGGKHLTLFSIWSPCVEPFVCLVRLAVTTEFKNLSIFFNFRESNFTFSQ